MYELPSQAKLCYYKSITSHSILPKEVRRAEKEGEQNQEKRKKKRERANFKQLRKHGYHTRGFSLQSPMSSPRGILVCWKGKVSRTSLQHYRTAIGHWSRMIHYTTFWFRVPLDEVTNCFVVRADKVHSGSFLQVPIPRSHLPVFDFRTYQRIIGQSLVEVEGSDAWTCLDRPRTRPHRLLLHSITLNLLDLLWRVGFGYPLTLNHHS